MENVVAVAVAVAAKPMSKPPPRDLSLEGWTEALHDKWAANLTFQELRKGAQAVSDVYVHGRAKGGLAKRAVDGRAKRAAFACYYGVIHAIVVSELFGPRGPLRIPAGVRCLDFGCGPGALGAGLAAGGAEPSSVHGLDLVGANVEMARWTYDWWGLTGGARVGRLPRALGTPRTTDLIGFGWCVNELIPADRKALWGPLQAAVVAGSGILLIEPLSRRAVSWWSEAERALCHDGAKSIEFRVRVDLPTRVRDLDRATGLNHSEVGARVLFKPPGGSGTSR